MNLLAQALNAVSDLILVKDERSRILWANDAFCKLYGMTAEELYGAKDSERSDPDDTLQYVKDDRLVFRTGKSLDIPSEPVTDSEGNVRYFHTKKFAIRDEKGNVFATAGVSREVLDADTIARSEYVRKKQKETLAGLREFIEHIPAPVAMLDANLHIVHRSLLWNGRPIPGMEAQRAIDEGKLLRTPDFAIQPILSKEGLSAGAVIMAKDGNSDKILKLIRKLIQS